MFTSEHDLGVIHLRNPYEEGCPTLWSKEPRSTRDVPDPKELEDHVPLYIPSLSSMRFSATEDEATYTSNNHPFIFILHDHAAVRAEIEVLRRERLAYEQESIQTRQDLARSEAHCRALEARVTVLETEVRRHEWQRQAADDLAVHITMLTPGPGGWSTRDTLEDTEAFLTLVMIYYYVIKMAPKKLTTSQHQSHQPQSKHLPQMFTEAQLQALLTKELPACNGRSKASRVECYNSNVS
ncbi:hypothetical protein Tco_0908256 [Tanacetum coccineum]|uniref:Uncharacterized protein n=1 Tax=Tanacetum coccineum TaxID=301880 RepID=A0ABQ5CLN7_9ASTR